MKKVAQFFVILALLASPFLSFAQNEAEILKINAQMQALDQEAEGLQRFAEKFYATLNERAMPNKEGAYLKLAFFDAKLFDVGFKIAITIGVLEAITNKETAIDPFVALTLSMLPPDKPPLEFVKDMLLVIRKSLDELAKEKISLQNGF